MRSGGGAQSSGWADAYGWTKPVNRSVGADALRCTTTLYNSNGSRLASNYGYNTSTFAAGVALETHASYNAYGSGSYRVVSSHQVRDPKTLNYRTYETYCNFSF